MVWLYRGMCLDRRLIYHFLSYLKLMSVLILLAIPIFLLKMLALDAVLIAIAAIFTGCLRYAWQSTSIICCEIVNVDVLQKIIFISSLNVINFLCIIAYLLFLEHTHVRFRLRVLEALLIAYGHAEMQDLTFLNKPNLYWFAFVEMEGDLLKAITDRLNCFISLIRDNRSIITENLTALLRRPSAITKISWEIIFLQGTYNV